MIALIKRPYLMATSAVASVAGLRMILISAKSIPPVMRPMIGMMMSFTTLFVIAVNAAPMITPTARSITFPRAMNFLNSPKNLLLIYLISI